HHEDRENHRNGGERFFSSGEESDVHDLLSGRLRENVDTGLENIRRTFGIDERESRLATAEDDREETFETIRDRFEGLPEAFFRSFIDVLDRLVQVVDRLQKIRAFGREVIEAFFLLFVFVDRAGVHVTETAN